MYNRTSQSNLLYTFNAVATEAALINRNVVIEKFHYVEEVSEPYTLTVDVYTLNPDIDMTLLLYKKISVVMDPANTASSMATKAKEEVEETAEESKGISSKRGFDGYVTQVQFLGYATPTAGGNILGKAEHQAQSTLTGMGGRAAKYRLIARPAFWFFKKRFHCQIFQEKALKEILELVFAAHAKPPFDPPQLMEPLIETPFLYKYCVQYNESDFNFISRLLEEKGIHYFYTTKVLGKGTKQSTETLLTIKETPAVKPQEFLEYRDSAGGNLFSNALLTLNTTANVMHGKFLSADYNYLTPEVHINPKNPMPEEPLELLARGNYFRYPGHYTNMEEGEFVNTNMLRNDASQRLFLNGTTTYPSLHAGGLYEIKNYPLKQLAKAQAATEEVPEGYFVLKVEHFGQQEFGENEIIHNTSVYHNKFTAIPNTEPPYAPPQKTPKPVVHGYQSAVVVGPEEAQLPSVQAVVAETKTKATAEEEEEATEEGEEETGDAEATTPPTPPNVFTDPQGRIAVKFIWDVPVDDIQLAQDKAQLETAEGEASAEEAEEEEKQEQVEAESREEETKAESSEEESEAGGGEAEEGEEEAQIEAESAEEKEGEAAEAAAAAEESQLPPPPGSCWIRVAQSLAGPGYGCGFIPRIGMEVIIIFENGNINKPLVVGCVYNGVNWIPEPLSEEPNRLVIQTMGPVTPPPDDPIPANLIMLQDTPMDEQRILIRAQNEFKKEVMLLDETTVIQGGKIINLPGETNANHVVNINVGSNVVSINEGNNEIQITAGNHILNIKEGNITIGTESGEVAITGTNINITAEEGIEISAGADISISAGGAMETQVGGDSSLEVTGAAEFTAGGDISVEATGAVEISGGGDVSVEAIGAVEVSGGGDVSIEAGGATEVSAGADVAIQAGGATEVSAGGDVSIEAGGATEVSAGGAVTLEAGGIFNAAAGGEASMEAGGLITIDAGGLASVNAPLIMLE